MYTNRMDCWSANEREIKFSPKGSLILEILAFFLSSSSNFSLVFVVPLDEPLIEFRIRFLLETLLQRSAKNLARRFTNVQLLFVCLRFISTPEVGAAFQVGGAVLLRTRVRRTKY